MSPVPRRSFLTASSGTALTGGLLLDGFAAPPARAEAPSPDPVPPAPAAAEAGEHVSLRFTDATNGAATATAGGDRVVAEVQGVLWAVPRDGSAATALTPPDLEPNRPVFSPDGRQIAMSAYRDGAFHIWLMRADGSGLRRLTDGPWDDRAPAWSPDGRTLAFCSERGGDPVTGAPYRIWTVSVRDGALTQVTGLPGRDGPGQDHQWEDFDPAWTADGSRLLFVRAGWTAPVLTARTLVSAAADGSAARVEHTAAEGNLLAPAVSPAGRTVWLRSTPGPPKTEAIALFVDGRQVALDAELAPAPPRWIDDEQLLLTVGGRFRVIRPHRDDRGHEIALDATLRVRRPRYTVKEYALEAETSRPVRGIHQPSLSPDGRGIAFAALNALWVVGVSGGSPRKILQSPPTAYVQGPVWSPDGRALIWTDDRDGLGAVRRRELDGGAESVLAPGGRVHGVPSPDGTRLACLDMAGNLLVRELSTGAERVLATPLGGGGLPGRPSWSPDGRYLALCDRNRLNFRFREGHNLIRVVDTHTGAARCTAWPRTCPCPTGTPRGPSGPRTGGRWPASASPRCGCFRWAPTAPLRARPAS